jgi:cold shock protein
VNDHEQVWTLLSHIAAVPVSRASASGEDLPAWFSLWAAVADRLLQQIESGHLPEFDAGFEVVRDALLACDAICRDTAMPVLFGDFTRRAIAAGIDRARFVDWFGPAEILRAPSGRVRGRVLYFNNAKGRGKVLGADRNVYFVHFSMIQGSGFRSLAAGQLVEFRPESGSFNGVLGLGAYDLRLVETSGDKTSSVSERTG